MSGTRTYTTLGRYGEGRFEDRRSVFIGQAAHVADEAAAREFVASVKKQYSDARHHAWAYHMTEGGIARYSDDGEPQGTAGLPILSVINGSGALDCAVVVTRYFGGILLGTGGLVHAYSEAAKLAVADAGVVVYREYAEMSLTATYSDYQRVSAELPKFGAIVDDTDFGVNVTVRTAVPSERADEFAARILEITSGRTAAESRGVRFDA